MKQIFTITALLTAALLLPSGTAAAEDTTTTPPLKMEELSIKILPEYAFHPKDQKKTHPPLLVGYQGTLVNTSSEAVDGKIEIALPVSESNFRIGYVADYSSDLKTAHELSYEWNQQTGTISWRTSEKIEPQQRYKFTIEFYSDSLQTSKSKRTLHYKFTSFADIDLVTMEITKPYKAGKMKLSPDPGKNSHSEGDSSAGYLFHDVKKGDEKGFTLSYSRSETTPTLDLLEGKSKDGKKEKNHYAAIASFSGIGLGLAAFAAIVLKKRKRND